MPRPAPVVGHQNQDLLDSDDQRRRVVELAEAQDGLLNAAQLQALGVGAATWHWWTRNARLHQVAPNVYAVGHRALSSRGWRRAALLSAGEDSALAHSTALRHGGVADLWDQRLHVVVPRGSCAPRDRFVVHRTVLLDERDVEVIDGLRCTTVARTLIDLAGSVPVSTLAYACRQTEYKRLLDVVAIGHTLARMNRPRGVRALRHVLAAAGIEGAILETRLEQRLLQAILEQELPQPLTQVWFDLRPDHKRARVDFWYPQARLVVEADGPHHRLPLQRADDERRDTVLAERGIEVVRVPDTAIDAGPAVAVAPIASALTRRWSSESTPS